MLLTRGQFFGSVEGCVKFGPLTLTENRYESRQLIPTHAHERAYFCFVLDGTYEESSGSTSVLCRPGTVVFHPDGVPHSDRFQDVAGRCFNIECDATWLTDLDSDIQAASGPVYVRDAWARQLMTTLYRETRASDGFASLAIEGLTRALVAAVARGAADSAGTLRGPPWLQEVVETATREYATGYPLSEAARRVGVHPRHLARTFRDSMGCSLGEFVRRKRVEAARLLLDETQMSLSRIAFRTGFADQSHFTRTFRNHVGLTPSAYRRQLRSDPSRSKPSR